MPYIKKIRKFTNIGLKLAWHWTQNLVGWAGLLVAVFTLYLQTAGKEHSLNIVISSIYPAGEEVTFGIIYNNTGSYTEIITDASASLSNDKNLTVSWGDTLEDCFEPIVLKPGDAAHKYYTAKLPYYGLKKEPDKDGNLESDLALSFTALMPNAETQRFGLTVGEVKHRALEGTFSSLEIKKNLLKVNFEDAPPGTYSLSLPDRSSSSICAKKRRSRVN